MTFWLGNGRVFVEVCLGVVFENPLCYRISSGHEYRVFSLKGEVVLGVSSLYTQYSILGSIERWFYLVRSDVDVEDLQGAAAAQCSHFVLASRFRGLKKRNSGPFIHIIILSFSFVVVETSSGWSSLGVYLQSSALLNFNVSVILNPNDSSKITKRKYISYLQK